MIVTIDEMKSCIQEWFVQPVDAVTLAKVYAEVLEEINYQLEYRMKCLTEKEAE